MNRHMRKVILLLYMCVLAWAGGNTAAAWAGGNTGLEVILLLHGLEVILLLHGILGWR